jgi:hypothetical protein
MISFGLAQGFERKKNLVSSSIKSTTPLLSAGIICSKSASFKVHIVPLDGDTNATEEVLDPNATGTVITHEYITVRIKRCILERRPTHEYQ